MMDRRSLLAAAAGTLALPALARAQAPRVTLRLKWLPNAQFAGFYLAQDRGYYREAGLDLTINPGGPNLLTENLIATGADTFGVSGGSESVFAARERNLPIVCVGMGHQVTPFTFVTRADGPIRRVEDFPGKRVTAWFTGAQLVLQGIIASRGLSAGAVTISPQQVSFTPFINGDADVVTATLYTDVALLRARMGQDSLRLFTPEDYGITIPRDTVIVSERTAAENPDRVQAFLRASIRGWQEAKRDPTAAVAAVMKAAPTLNREQEGATLVEILKLMGAGAAATQGLFTLDHGVITRAGEFLLRYGALTRPVDVDAGFKPQFLAAIPSAERMLG